MIRRRAMVGGAIIAAWLAGLAVLVHREYFRPEVERLADAALRITPAAVFYGVMQGGVQVGFASTTIDTARASITVDDYLVADVPVRGKAQRTTARTRITLTRGLRVTAFDISLQGAGALARATGTIGADSVLTLTVDSGAARPATRHVQLHGPILLPTLVPLALALSETPKLGKRYTLPVFDPASMTSTSAAFDVRAESAFVVNDSSVFDSTTQEWRGVQPDTVRAWQVAPSEAGGFHGWIDEQGRVVQTTQLGFLLRRLPYEVAFENWRARADTLAVAENRNVLESTVIAANQRMGRRIDTLRMVLDEADLEAQGFAVGGQGQRLSRDTLIVVTTPDSVLTARYVLPGWTVDRANTRAEPLIESRNPAIVRLAQRIRAGTHDPRVAAQRINQWVHDSIANRVTVGVPSAAHVLAARAGDCDEHARLFVALARAVGLPARIASGLAYVNGKFYYHAWAEVRLGDWVPVDPTFGQFPADAAHVRLVLGGPAQQAALLRLMGSLRIDVLSANAERTR